MPVNLATFDDKPRLILEGVVTPEEVDRLHELIRENRDATADLSACEHLHTAALQLLLTMKIPITSSPESHFWSHFFTEQEITDR